MASLNFKNNSQQQTTAPLAKKKIKIKIKIKIKKNKLFLQDPLCRQFKTSKFCSLNMKKWRLWEKVKF